MKVTTLLTLLFLTSCAHHKIDYNSFSNFPANKKAIVILKLTSSPAIQMTLWCKFNEQPLSKEICINIKPENNYKILILEPGQYEVSQIEKINYRYKVTIQKINPDFSNITHKRRTQPTILFEADTGKINYVGHIKYHEYSTKISVEDEFEEISNKNLFNNYEFEFDFINQQKNLITKNLAKTKTDLAEEKKIKKSYKKSQKKKLKELSKKPKKNLKDYL